MAARTWPWEHARDLNAKSKTCESFGVRPSRLDARYYEVYRYYDVYRSGVR
jgi:hypothetical protein